MGDSVLEKKAKIIKEVTPRIRALAEDMLETMYESGGVGLAAPQVGILKRLVVIDITEERDEPYTMLNPEIIEQDGEQTGYEGCLSVPGKLGVVTRPNRVVVRYNDLDMNEWEMEAEDFLARAICHELDHLDGHLYVEKVEGELRDAAELEKEMEEEAEQAQEETEEA
jgi:peptide deformylase